MNLNKQLVADSIDPSNPVEMQKLLIEHKR